MRNSDTENYRHPILDSKWFMSCLAGLAIVACTLNVAVALAKIDQKATDPIAAPDPCQNLIAAYISCLSAGYSNINPTTYGTIEMQRGNDVIICGQNLYADRAWIMQFPINSTEARRFIIWPGKNESAYKFIISTNE